ncbi:MAG: endonuclease, partial [Planctomycetota bacterium]
MPKLISLQSLCALAVFLVAETAAFASDPWAAPAGYYNAATGTGAALSSQLRSIMSSGHIQRTYGNFRFSAAITDRDPNNPSNILLAYTRQSVPGTWDSGNTWNREHTWPQSRQPGSASNSSLGNLGDPHALRPARPSVNSQRGNRPFGTTASSGSNGPVGSYYYPGDADAGDTARQLFYSATRYNLSLVNDFPSGNQMGDLASLLKWHYEDAPDEFERRRNHTIYSEDENPFLYTNNRNAFVDRPELVWSVFADQQNDTRLTLSGGSGGSTDGASTLDLNLGAVYAGGAAPASTAVSLTKAGSDGTYYAVTTAGNANTDAGEISRAVEMGAGWSDSFNV